MRIRQGQNPLLGASRNRRAEPLRALLRGPNLRVWLRPGLPGSGTTWTDNAGQIGSMNATISGTYSWSRDLAGRLGVLVNGTGNYAVTGANTGISGDAAFTMAVWVELKSLANGGICGIGNIYVARNSCGIYMLSNKPLMDFAGGNYLTPPNALTTGKMYFLCYTKAAGAIGNTNCKIYYDAVDQGSSTVTGSGTPSITDSPFYVNRDANYGASGESSDVSANALYSQLMLFNRALTPGEVKALYDLFR